MVNTTKPAKRTCPRCGSPVHVTKSITPTKGDLHVEKLQTLKCSGCPTRGVVISKEEITWQFPDLDEAGQEHTAQTQ